MQMLLMLTSDHERDGGNDPADLQRTTTFLTLTERRRATRRLGSAHQLLQALRKKGKHNTTQKQHSSANNGTVRSTRAEDPTSFLYDADPRDTFSFTEYFENI